jgi:hypothetical protein
MYGIGSIDPCAKKVSHVVRPNGVSDVHGALDVFQYTFEL